MHLDVRRGAEGVPSFEEDQKELCKRGIHEEAKPLYFQACLQRFLAELARILSGRFQGIPEACARLHANSGEAWQSLANFGDPAMPYSRGDENILDIHQSSGEGPPHMRAAFRTCPIVLNHGYLFCENLLVLADSSVRGLAHCERTVSTVLRMTQSGEHIPCHDGHPT